MYRKIDFTLFARTFFILSCILFSYPSSAEEKSVEHALDKLDQVLDMSPTYDAYFFSRVESLRSMLENEEKYSKIEMVNFKLATEFSHFCLDSSLFYVEKNMRIADRIGDKGLKYKSDLYRAYFYSIAGFYIEAEDIIRSYNPDTLSFDAKLAYYRAYRKLSYELDVYSPNLKNNVNISSFSRARLLEMLPEGTYEWYDVMREEALCNGDADKERECILKMLGLAKEGTNAYATACYYYSTTFAKNSDEELYWLVTSSVSDVMSATKDYHSLICVADIMFGRGDIKRAFKYLVYYSLPDAIYYNGKLRPLQIARYLPEIEREYQKKLSHETFINKVFLFVLCIMLVILIAMLCVIVYRNNVLTKTRNRLQSSKDEIEAQNIKLKEMYFQVKNLNGRMKDADKIKEEYISLFLSILSDNINTTRKYKNHILRNLRKGNVKGLIEEIEMLPPIDEDINEFYKMFDQTFVNMYPDFVSRFNSLLQEGEEIVPKGNELLAPDHRIFALILLGIVDSSKIAALLHYSTNTIYNYKARIKNKAKVDRDKFEEYVRNLYAG